MSGYIECKNLTLQLKNQNKILDNINISMEKGKVYIIKNFREKWLWKNNAF